MVKHCFCLYQAEMFDPSGCYERASIPSVIMGELG